MDYNDKTISQSVWCSCFTDVELIKAIAGGNKAKVCSTLLTKNPCLNILALAVLATVWFVLVGWKVVKTVKPNFICNPVFGAYNQVLLFHELGL